MSTYGPYAAHQEQYMLANFYDVSTGITAWQQVRASFYQEDVADRLFRFPTWEYIPTCPEDGARTETHYWKWFPKLEEWKFIKEYWNDDLTDPIDYDEDGNPIPQE